MVNLSSYIPISVKNLLKYFEKQKYFPIPYRIRKFDREFYKFFNILIKNEKKTYEEIRNYQFFKFKTQVINAYKFSEFYKNKFDDFGFNPKNLKDFNDIKEIPTLSKEEVRKNSKLMVLNNFHGKLYFGYTSGTTGKPLKLYFDKKAESREWASICYQWARIGYSPTDGRVEFRGFIENDIDYLYFPNNSILRINIVKMSEKNINLIIKKIKSTGYQFFHGYPSAIYKFAKILENTNIKINPKGIMLASEVLYDWQMEAIDQIFPNSKKIAHYGQAEKVALGAWNKRREYFFIPSYGLFEFDEKTNEIIATGFINEIMPFIRYKLTDTIQEYQETPKKFEKTLFPVVKTIEGRQEDYIYNIKGELIPPAIVTFPFKKLNQIKACKIIQHSLKEFELLIEADKNNLTIKEANKITSDLKKIFGSNINLITNIIDKIPVDRSGKFRWIENKIKKK